MHSVSILWTSRHSKEELDTDGWIRTLQQARKLGSVQCGFSGGEPLLRDDLETLVGEAHRLGFYTNMLTTGVGLTDARARALKDNGLDHIQLSFQDSSREMNDFLPNTRTFDLKHKVAAMIKEYDWPIVLNCVIHRMNIEHIDKIIEMALELGAETLELANTQYYSWAVVNRDHLLPCQAFLLAGDPDLADPVCDKSPDKHVVDKAIQLAQSSSTYPQGEQPLIFRDPKESIRITEGQS